MDEKSITKTARSSYLAHVMCCNLQKTMAKPVDIRIYGGFKPYAVLSGADGTKVTINIEHSMP